MPLFRNVNYARQFHLFALVLHITACSQVDLPEYWLCSGTSQQTFTTHSGQILSTHSGREQVLLERYKDTVFQFNAPALFGLFVVCASTPGQWLFRNDQCTIPSDNSSVYREGVLTLADGQLRFNDRRTLPDGVATVHAEYTCKPLGSSYSFKDLEDQPNAH